MQLSRLQRIEMVGQTDMVYTSLVDRSTAAYTVLLLPHNVHVQMFVYMCVACCMQTVAGSMRCRTSTSCEVRITHSCKKFLLEIVCT